MSLLTLDDLGSREVDGEPGRAVRSESGSVEIGLFAPPRWRLSYWNWPGDQRVVAANGGIGVGEHEGASGKAAIALAGVAAVSQRL